MIATALAALWIVGLLLAAPALRSSQSYRIADRLRDAMILGVAIPGTLAIAGIFYAAACWIVLAAALAAAWMRERRRVRSEDHEPTPYGLVAMLAAIAWPPLIRPLLDGDSLSYHLPNAASWVHAHSLWIASTHYWWYPFGSELFGAGIYATSGPFALGWTGFIAIALLGFRIFTWCRERAGTSPTLAQAIACATVGIWPLAQQAGSLQNDVWLAAFLAELVWLHGDRAATLRTGVVAALIKPYGWLLALCALPALRIRLLPIVAVLALMAIRFGALLAQSPFSLASMRVANPWQTTILAHGFPGIVKLAQVFAEIAPLGGLAFLLALSAPLWHRNDRKLAWFGALCALVFLVLPFSYSNPLPQLASGASLRFAAPAIVIGMMLFAHVAARTERIALPLCLAFSLWEAGVVTTVYWNDAPTRTALAVAIVAVAVFVLAKRIDRAWPIPAALAIAVTSATFLAGAHPVDYYVDATAVNGARSQVFAWIFRTHPPRVMTWGLRSGIVAVLSPPTLVSEATDSAPCEDAKHARAMLLAMTEADRDAATNTARRASALACGFPIYEDALAVVTQGY